jgi:hypothetical protein
MSTQKERVYFPASGSERLEITPSAKSEIAIEYDNRENRPLSINVTIECSDIDELSNFEKTFDFKPNDLGIYRIPFKAPSKFDEVKIDVRTQPRFGLRMFSTAQTNHTQLLLVPMISKSVGVEQAVDQTKILDTMRGKSLVLVPDESAKPYSVPVIGDVSVEPLISFGVLTTDDITIQLQCNARTLKTFETAAKNAGADLDKVASAQDVLRYFIELFKKFYIKQGATAEGPVGTAHVKVSGPGLSYLMFVTQVSPKEDARVAQNIQKLIDEGKKMNATVSVVVTSIDDVLVGIAKNNTINVVDIFHGFEVRGVWTGDQLISKFVVDELELTLSAYGTKNKGYSSSEFEEAINNTKGDK